MPEVHVFMAEGRTDEQKKNMMGDITKALVDNLGVTRRGDRPDCRGEADRQDEGRQDLRGALGRATDGRISDARRLQRAIALPRESTRR